VSLSVVGRGFPTASGYLLALLSCVIAFWFQPGAWAQPATPDAPAATAAPAAPTGGATPISILWAAMR
jgi:hypothetical protein